MLRVFLSLLLICLTVLSNGQATRLYDYRDYGFGELSSNLINSIAQDRHGYIWIATEYGLNKFDGVRFSQYLHDVQDSTSISSNHVTILHRDDQERLWIGCSNGLQYYNDNREQFIRIKFPDQIAPHIIDILTRADGSLWVATSGWGIFSIDIKAGAAHSLEHVNKLAGGMYGRKLLEDSKRRVWIATDRAGVICISADLQHTKKFSDSEVPFPKGGKYNMTNIPTGDIILAYNSQVVLADKSLTKFTSLPFENNLHPMINEIRLAQDGSIVISTEGGGIWHLKLSEHPLLIRQTELSNLDKNYSKAGIRTFFQDQESNFWLGWFQRGLVFIPASSHQFEFWRILETEETDSKKINVITTDQQRHIWYSVEDAGLFKVDSTGHILKRYPELHDIMQVLEDKRGDIWFLSYRRGLGKIEEGKSNAIYLDIFRGKETRTMVLGKNGKLYISTFGNGFVEYDPRNNTSNFFTMNDTLNPNGVLGNDWINTILCDRNGLIWLGHHKGISCYDPQKQTFINQWANESLSEQIVLSLLEDKYENIWVGTYNGLHKIDKRSRQLTSYTANNGLSSNVISGLGEDKKGNIWCSTFNGINYINPTEDRIVTYYTGDGLVDRSYNRSVYYQDPQGKIYFGGKQGITSFYPEQVQLTKYTHPVYITNLYIRNQTTKPWDLSGGRSIYTQSLATANEFYFGNQDDSFTLELSTMDFNSPENIHYEYRLKGFNKTWNTTLPGVNLITYNNLSPGEHELEIRACKFGAYSESRFLTLHVMPPWYRSTLAYLVYLILFIGILILIANYLRERRLEKLHAYKLQLFTDISHEIRSPLTLVLSPIDKLIKNTLDPHAKETLQNMRRNAHRILNLVNQLLDIRKLESGQLQLKFKETNLADLAVQCAQSFEQQAQERNIRFKVSSGSTYIPVWIDTNSLDKVLHNLLSNAFKYTPDGGTVDVHVSSSLTKQNTKQPSYAEITVSDTGPGIPDDDKTNIFKRFYQGNNQISGGQQGSGIGLHLTQVLVEKHGGKVSAENRTDEPGSCFRVHIPMGTSHLPKTLLANDDDNKTVVVEKPHIMQVPEPIAPNVVSHKTNFKVLIVDDEKDILRYVSQELQGLYKILSAENGSEAFQLALSQLPDLIISDVSMPDMDGFELVKKIKCNSTTNHIPVILLTAKINYEDRMQGIGLGADAYLTKPFLMEELVVMAENVIKNRMTVKGKYSGAQEQQGKVKTISFKSSDEILMERIVSITNKYLEDSSLNVQLLADEVGLSRVQLHRKVKALTGISTSEFIRNIRLKQAEKLLLEKQMNISQVAYALGFTNQTHFSTLFKKMYGLSPSEYINRHAKQHG
ncbi:hybrid sensor histidine kinase/response regulator transcription factor [Sphingobacterium gobiense]|uniref:histidine kinase n=1 Tax=Sphingobacterium gobiense TaxID=1382456 RepID=A0A2S9JN68_9SPHI|nr:hybrid sensor histidine kinase/response regulator transcription factor [Sphingobacterium gobiense]PRD54615.1 hybrid sensor histidine kinase/response regulator [Sphingobacterium gobiense]